MDSERSNKGEIKHSYPISIPVPPFVSLSSVTENNSAREKSTSGYCFSEHPFEVGGHFLPRVLNEPFVYVLLVSKSLNASKSSTLSLSVQQ